MNDLGRGRVEGEVRDMRLGNCTSLNDEYVGV